MKPLATLSVDLDNEWSYLKTRGDHGWQTFPSYLNIVVPRILDFLAQHHQRVTFFVVGQDAALNKNREALLRIVAEGHEVSNHSFSHEPWMHLYTREEAQEEIVRAEDAIAEATSRVPIGFRGPGYSISATVLEVLALRGYKYDASTLPTFIGPLARAYYFFGSRLSHEERQKRAMLFGSIRDALLPLEPYIVKLEAGSIVEIPVTTFPILRLPIHPSYLLYLARYSRRASDLYAQAALWACQAFGISPSILLHPLDFLDVTEVPSLSFFPAMDMPAPQKIDFLHRLLELLQKHFIILPLGEFADKVHHKLREGPFVAKDR